MNENKNKYISLKTAAGLYGYTRDHLGLMIRQGKLKGIKLGSYYVTKSEWISDYLKNYGDPGHPTTAGKFSNKFLTQAFASRLPAEVSAKEGDVAKKEKIKIPQADVSSKFKDDFFSEIQKELLPSLQELSKARETTGDLPAFHARRYTDTGDPYVILPIRKMEESECEEILRKISNSDKSKKLANGYHG